jgi:response regulator NasT
LLHCNIFCAWHNEPVSDADLAILIIDENRSRAAIIEAGLREAGHERVAVVSEMAGLVRRIEEEAPDVIVMDLGNPNRDFLEHMFGVSRAVRRPVAMFVDHSDSQAMRAAIEAGVSAYVVDGLRKERIKPILDLAILRFRAFEALRQERDRAQQALAERRTVDRAKGLIMKWKGVAEEDAYALLRDAAMRKNKRIIHVAEAFLLSAELVKEDRK